MEKQAIKTNEQMKGIQVPSGLDSRQIKLANAYVVAKQTKGTNVIDFCTENNISTKTWYQWQEDPSFKSYLTNLSNAAIPDDEWKVYELVKQNIRKKASLPNASIGDIKIFLETHTYLAKIDTEKRTAHLKEKEETTSNFKTIEERKASILARLRS